MNYVCTLVLMQNVVSCYVLQLELDLHSLAVRLFLTSSFLNFFIHHKEHNGRYENAADCRYLGRTVTNRN